jgi:hypothetical protein
LFFFGFFCRPLIYIICSALLAAAAAQGAPKKRKKSDVPTYLSSLRFLKIFMSDFGLLTKRNGQKHDKKKSMGKDERKQVLFSQLFRPKVFDMDFPQKVFDAVFELPLLRNAQKRH